MPLDSYFILYRVVLFLIIFIIQSEQQQNVKRDTYPWGLDTYESQQENILASLRKNLFIDVKSDAVSVRMKEAIDKENQILLNNRQNKSYLINIQPNPKDLSSKTLHKVYTNEATLNKKLHGHCAFYQEDNYWNFEWCHRKEVRQVHLEFVHDKLIRNPDWSLGKYEMSKIIREGKNSSNTSAPITTVIDYFTHGQRCDETGSFRKTAVVISCCHLPVLSDAPDGSLTSDPANSIVFKSVKETNVCEYEFHICVPFLCLPSPINEVDLRKEFGTKLVKMMQTLKPKCLLHHEAWWTFELCFGSGIRQFHLHMEISNEGGVIQQKQVIQNEFSLGLAPLMTYTNATALQLAAGSNFNIETNSGNTMTSNVDVQSSSQLSSYVRDMSSLPASGMPLSALSKITSSVGPKSIILEFTNGTLCDIIESVTRSSTVHISCGPRDAIIDVIEDRTCHYNIKVTSPLICQHSEFAPIQQRFERIEFLRNKNISRVPPAAFVPRSDFFHKSVPTISVTVKIDPKKKPRNKSRRSKKIRNHSEL